MAITTAQLTDALEKSGLLTADRIKDCCETAAIPMETTSSEAVAKQLVRSGHLTRFQAQLALSGKASSLVIGSYVVLEKIGQGGMGQVYKARHKTMKREVALKVISPAVVKDETSRRRFQREVEAAAQLNHPNIVTAHDAGEFKGTHYLVMEYIKGTDLSLLVKAEGPISLESAVGYILQVARGLSFAHSQGIVHRDIKPANLLLDESGLVKILDMGLARFDDSNNAMNTDAALTGTGMLMGTIDYMSPEQAMDSKNADARSDIYSLGCTLYFLTTGRAMFETDTIVKRLMAHQSAIIPRISHADLGLQQILEKMTAKQPEQRYASCEQLIAELQVWINNNTVAGAPQRSAVSQGSGSRMSTPDLRTVSDNVASDSSDATMDTFVFAARNLTAAETTPSLSTSAETLLPVPDSPQRPPSTHTLPAVAASTAAPAKKLVMPETVALESAPSIIVDTQTALSSRGRSRVRLQNRNPQAAGGKGGRRSWQIYGGLAGGAAVVLLAVLVFRLKTPTGTIIIEADQPDIAGAVISVDEKQTITLEIGNGQEPIEIRADEKEHTLKVTKGGFESFTQKFRVKAGATQTITVRLEPTDLERTAKPDVMAPGKKTAGPGWHGWPADAPPPAIAPFNAEQAKQHQKAWAKYLKIDVEYTNSIGMKFRLIPPGEFTMGSTAEEIEEALKFAGEDKHWQDCIKSEAPQHKVILTQPIYLGVNEVTQAEYEKVMGVNPSQFAPSGEGKEAVAGMETTSHPVEQVSWNDAVEFCAKLSKQEELKPFYFRAGETVTPLDGTGYRLPTEAEWEYTCRAGTTTKFWIGDKDEELVRAGWFGTNAGRRTHAAGELKANPYGLCDIHGNIWEWVQDVWEPAYYSEFAEKPAVDPNGPSSASSERLIRGGHWNQLPSTCRAANRNAVPPTARHHNTHGFRVSLVAGVRPKPAGSAKTDVMAHGKKTAGSGWHGWPADAPPPAIAPFNAEQAEQHQKAWAKYLKIDVEYTNSIGMKFRLIPPGEFMMGSTAAEIEEALIKYADKHQTYLDMIKSEAPQHKVILTQAIYLGVNEVTQAEYEKVMGVNPSHSSPMGAGKEVVAGMDTTRHPVETVSWNDAAEFCAKLSKQEELKPFYLRAGEIVTPLDGTGYQLPTEAEWEYACRAGTTTKYWIGDKEEDLLRAGWLGTNLGFRTNAAGELKANPYGLCDIHGNVCEFVQDMWDLDYYSEFAKTPASDPVNPHSDTFPRVVRGGHCADDAVGCRAAYRDGYPYASPAAHIGFRVALAVTVRPKPAGPAMPKSVATTPSTPASDAIDFAAERKAAEWVLSVGGSVQTIDEAGVILFVGPGGKLPDGQWQLNTVWLTNCKNIKSGDLEKLASCRSLITLHARATNMGDADCQAIGRITNLESLDLTGSSQITNTGIKNLAPLRKLRTLGLTFLPISDEAMDVIAGMTELRSLDFGESGVGDEGLAKLKTLDKLEQFSLAPNITDRGLVHLTDFPNLAFVGVKAHQVTDVGVANLRKLPKLDSLLVVSATDADLERLKTLAHLKNLTLIYSQFSASSVENLQAFPQLEILNLNGSANIDDSHLVALSKLKKLRQLFVEGTSVTPEGIAKFRELRPDVELSAGGKVYPAVAGPIDYEAERKAAEWVLSVGGQLGTVGVHSWVVPGGKLPDGQWELSAVSFSSQSIKSVDLDKLASCRNVKRLTFWGTDIGDAGCVAIGRMTNLEDLTLLGNNQITNVGIQHLGSLQKLRRLSLAHFPLSDDAMDVIAGMTQLRSLALVETPVTDLGFKKLAPLVHLEENLVLPLGVTDQGLSILGNFPQLKKLGLYGHQVTDSSIAEIQKLPKLTELYLIGATDQNLSRIKGLTQLRGLELNLGLLTEQGYQTLQEFKWLQNVAIGGDPKFDDTRLMRLSEFTDLKFVYFDKSSSVTPKGIENFQAARPDVRVSDGVQEYPATLTIDAVSERKAAEWAIGRKVDFQISTAEGLVQPTDLAQLPNGPFHVHYLDLTAQPNLTKTDVELIGRLRKLKTLSLNETQVDDSSLPGISQLTELEYLILLKTRVTDAGLAALVGLRNLKTLDLTFTAVTDDGMDSVAALTSLRVLGLGECQVGDEGLAKLKSLCHLEHIHLGGHVTDQGLKHIADFPNLTSVAGLKSHHLTETGISHLQQLTKCTSMNVVAATDEDLIRLKSLTNLKTVEFNFNQFTVSGLETLHAFPQLEILNLNEGANIDDSHLVALSKLKKLRQLFVDGTSVTPEGIAKFRELRPDVELSAGGKVYPAVAGPIDYEAERKAAEWVLSVGGELNTMNEAGGWVHVTPGGELPDGRWHLRLVLFTNYKNINSGDLERLASCRNLKVLSVRGASIGDADCLAIGRMANLENLGLLGCAQITNAGIKNLGPLRKLHHLDLAFTPISDEAMDVIAGMTELRTLALNETQVTDVGFKKLAPLVLLENLGPSPGVTDQGLSILGNFPQLKILDLKGHQITDTSVAQLQKLPKLTTFSLVGGTDDNLLKIKGLTQLRWLGLNLCQFTEQGFQTLLDFKWLHTVNITGDPKFDDTRLMSLSEITDLKLVLFDKSSSVSPKGIENFRAARPDVRVNDGVQEYPATVPAKAEEK